MKQSLMSLCLHQALAAVLHEVTGHHTRRLGEIVAQTYEFQLDAYLAQEHRSRNRETITEKKKWDAFVLRQNYKRVIRAKENQPTNSAAVSLGLSVAGEFT